MKSYGYIVEEAAQYSVLSDSFDYELRGKRKNGKTGRWLVKHREEVIEKLRQEILSGTFEPGPYIERTIKERLKERTIQSIALEKTIGIHAIMTVVEKRMTPSFIADSAASIKGRGGVYLLNRIKRDLKNDYDGCHVIYKDDINKFYQSIDQDLMMQVIRKKFRDKRLVAILERFVRMLPKGLSIGMRPSQGLANLLLSICVDHILKDRDGVRYYRRYCDDRVIQSSSKVALTKHVKTIREGTEKAGLTIKHTAQVFDMENRPLDFLGYIIDSNGKVRIRKHIKQRFARRWKRIRSKKRKEQLIGSFYGLAKHANARHLFKKITGIDMTTFAESGFQYKSKDGKKEFAVQSVQLSELVNGQIEVLDFETNIKTSNGEGRFLVLFQTPELGKRKFWTNSEKMKQALEYMRNENKIPFTTIVKRDGKYGYMFT